MGTITLLTDKECRNARPSKKLQKLTEDGLQLWVQPNGSRLWRFAYRYHGRQKLLALGPYPRVSLADARKARDKAKNLLLDGVDPSEERKEKQRVEQAETETFKVIAKEFVAKLEREGRAEITLRKKRWLLDFAYEAIGDTPIRAIGASDILKVLRKVEGRGHYETARRLRSTIGAVFRYAVATARAETDPTYALQGALITPTVTSMAAITEPKALGALLRSIDGYEGLATTKAALQLLALLFPRPGELRSAEWVEFDTAKAVWTIPAHRMKMRREHRIPLPRQAIEIIETLRPVSGEGTLLFPSERTRERPFSENTLNAALRRMGYSKDQVTSHGFRSTASTLLNESGYWNADAIEKQLSHAETNQIRRAYARGVYWEERIAMMNWWADYLDFLKSGARDEMAAPEYWLTLRAK
ncbi:MAG: integrase arm-type DNA-binding domain-containing protein, partial [Maricaulaceae bacterium]